MANTPLIEYTLEFVAQAGITDVIVYCGARTVDQVEQYLNTSRWTNDTSPFENFEILRSNATSVGDAMRDLDGRDIIKGDFLLVSGDVVANISIEPALAAHKARRAKDANSILTMVLREAGLNGHRTASQGKQSIFVLDPTADRCLHYEELRPRRKRKGRRSSSTGSRSTGSGPLADGASLGSRITIDPDLLNERDEIDVRTDLIDPHIDICTPDVLSLWSDNFDYQSLRTSFLYGVLKDYELNGKKLHTHIVNEGYAARVKSVRSYDAVSKDIIEGWTYPMRPDSNLLGQTYRLNKGKIYTERGVVLARGSRVLKHSVIGADSSIAEGSQITDSVIGRGCIIGKNVRITSSYIWDNTLIEDGAVIDHSIVASEAVIGKNVTLEPGSLVSFAVRVADNKTVTAASRLSLPEEKTSSTGFATNPTKSAPEDLQYASDSDSSVGSVGSGRLYARPNLSSLSLASMTSISTLHSDADSDLLPASGADGVPFEGRRPSTSSMSEDGGAAAARGDFVKELSASVLDGLTQDQSPDVIHLDVMNQRLTANASDSAIREALVGAFMRRIFTLHLENGVSGSEAANSVFQTYGAKILRQMGIRTADGEEARLKDEIEVLKAVEKECEGREKAESVLAFSLTAAYNSDVVSEEAILGWWEEGGGEEKAGRAQAARLVEHLQEESEEEDEDEDEEESEEEDEDSD